jgi:aldehyde dehydrogenase (NAD+)
MQVDVVDDLVQDAIRKGARVIKGGRALPGKPDKSLLYELTVLADVTHHMRIANEEAFGPVMTIMKFQSEVEEFITLL